MASGIAPDRPVDVSGRRFYPLLTAIVLLFVLFPFLVDWRINELLLTFLSVGVLLAGVYTLHREKGYLVVSSALAVVVIVFEALDLTTGAMTWTVLSQMASLLLSAFIAITIFLDVIRVRRVFPDTLLGAICVYFLIGFTFGDAYVLINLLHPGSFDLTLETVNDNTELTFELFYFSFATLTTTGYGDVIAVSRPAKMVSTLETVAGVFYLAVLVSRLVTRMAQKGEML